MRRGGSPRLIVGRLDIRILIQVVRELKARVVGLTTGRDRDVETMRYISELSGPPVEAHLNPYSRDVDGEVRTCGLGCSVAILEQHASTGL